MKKQRTADEAIQEIKKLCKSLGIPSTTNQKPEGTASIHFINKPKEI